MMSRFIALLIAGLIFFDLSESRAAVINHGPRDKRVVALTFDADMTPKMQKDLKSGRVKSFYNEKIITILERESIPATIFISGLWAETYPAAVKKIAGNPLFEIGNHTQTHAAFQDFGYGLALAADKKREILKAQKILNQLTGKKPTLFRFPGGCYSGEDVALVESLGLKVIGWDVISGDATRDSANKIYYNVTQKSTNGSIIVMHLSGGPKAPNCRGFAINYSWPEKTGIFFCEGLRIS